MKFGRQVEVDESVYSVANEERKSGKTLNFTSFFSFIVL